eukprot:CAMPEP_0172658304 /NCGR_PEP_ID=MMETSP1074-20121228/2712_1 /TAXON_ID=2916 /ORGANISM="Ceratium fusus, Strain PA161109" /LENGTH=323 /DNA_ID=CAMNT_0013473589 /DNA_START=86 /DNA_END=1054 /DNA_ORIENTATION=+
MAGGKPTMMPGDWTCPNCHDLVFARNATCRLCSTPRPDGGGSPMASQMASPKPPSPPSSATYTGPPGKGGAGASTYGGGGYASTAYNGPPSGGGGGATYTDMRAGDWHCPACFDLQFARNASCRRCGTLRPSAAPEPVAPSQRETPSMAPDTQMDQGIGTARHATTCSLLATPGVGSAARRALTWDQGIRPVSWRCGQGTGCARDATTMCLQRMTGADAAAPLGRPAVLLRQLTAQAPTHLQTAAVLLALKTVMVAWQQVKAVVSRVVALLLHTWRALATGIAQLAMIFNLHETHIVGGVGSRARLVEISNQQLVEGATVATG